MKVSVVIPIYNGAKTIAGLVQALESELAQKFNLGVVMVNDGSHDNSHETCREIVVKYPFVTYINLSKNFGEHNAVMAGLNYADGDYVVIIDDDFQNPPEEIHRLVQEALTKQYDIVYTYYKRKYHSMLKNLGSRFSNWVADFIVDKPKGLYLSSFKCLSRFTVQEIIKYKGPYPYIDGLALRCTRDIGKIEARHVPRREGRSGYTFRRLVGLWLNMFINFSVIPLRLSTFVGLGFSFLGMSLSIFVLIDKFYHPDIPMGWPSLIVAVMVFSGVQLVVLGLVGEYVGRLFLSSNQTPQFVIREIIKVK